MISNIDKILFRRKYLSRFVFQTIQKTRYSMFEQLKSIQINSYQRLAFGDHIVSEFGTLSLLHLVKSFWLEEIF